MVHKVKIVQHYILSLFISHDPTLTEQVEKSELIVLAHQRKDLSSRLIASRRVGPQRMRLRCHPLNPLSSP